MFKSKIEEFNGGGRDFLPPKALAEEISYSLDGSEILFIQKEGIKREEDGATQ